MNRTGAVAFVLVSLTALLLVTTTQQGGAQYSGTVTINADGTVDPADAPIQRVGDTYTLTSDVGGIGVQRSNIIIDGNGRTLPGIVTSIDSLGNNVTAKNAGGVYLKNVENIIVKNLTIKDCKIGIYLEQCSNVTVSGNTIMGTHVPVPQFQATGGIYVCGGNSNTITGNAMADNMVGIFLGMGTEHNLTVNNNLTGNTVNGLDIAGSSNNTISHNRFLNNTDQVYTIDSFNTWDDDGQGNYWSGYNGTDKDGDGVGDAPYVIDENNQDRYPLVDRVETPEFPNEENQSMLTMWIAASATSAVAAGAALLYFKKHRHQTKQQGAPTPENNQP